MDDNIPLEDTHVNTSCKSFRGNQIIVDAPFEPAACHQEPDVRATWFGLACRRRQASSVPARTQLTWSFRLTCVMALEGVFVMSVKRSRRINGQWKRRGGLGRVVWWGLGLLLCLSVAGGQMVAAQEPRCSSIQRLRIQVMPEFDDPRVLVIAQGRLAVADTDLPLPVTFRVPKEAQINQMAAMDMMTGATKSKSFETQADPDDSRWSLVTFTLDNAHFFYEYYFDPLVGETDKTFAFSFSSVQPVDDLLLEIQQPFAATDFALAPSPVATRHDETFGFTYHQFDIDALAAGEETLVEVSYTKTDAAPSVSREQLMSMQMGSPRPDMPPVAEAGQTSGNAPGWVFVLLGGVAIAVGGGFAWHHTRSDQGPMLLDMDVERSQFCTRCGTPLKIEADFCHICGAPVKPG